MDKTPDEATIQASLLVSKAGIMQSELTLALRTKAVQLLVKWCHTVRKTPVVLVMLKQFPFQLVETSQFWGLEADFQRQF